MEYFTYHYYYYMIILILVLVFVFLVYSGLFQRIDISVGSPQIGDFTAFYKYRIGPYRSCCDLFIELKSLVTKCESFGIFYNDPTVVEDKKQKCAIGAAFPATFLKKTGIDAMQEILVSHGWKKYWFPKPERAVMVKFPLKNRVSIFIAIHRVYPRLHKYLEENKFSIKTIIEYYKDDHMYFYIPLDSMDGFLVPEIL